MTRSLIISAPIDEAAAINAALEAAGKGPDNLSIPMRGDQIVEPGQHTHLGCHWWATDDEVALVRDLQQSIGQHAVVRDVPAELQPRGLFDATLGDYVEITHKQFGATWGWRAVMKTASGEFNPGVRAIAIYSDPGHQNYLYTTGAFVQSNGEWATEWNPGHAQKQDFHWALLWASVREAASTLRADMTADVAYLRYGLPVPDGPVGPPPQNWVPSGANFVSVLGATVINVSNTAPFSPGQLIRFSGVEVTVTSIWTPGAPGVLQVNPTPPVGTAAGPIEIFQ